MVDSNCIRPTERCVGIRATLQLFEYRNENTTIRCTSTKQNKVNLEQFSGKSSDIVKLELLNHLNLNVYIYITLRTIVLYLFINHKCIRIQSVCIYQNVSSSIPTRFDTTKPSKRHKSTKIWFRCWVRESRHSNSLDSLQTNNNKVDYHHTTSSTTSLHIRHDTIGAHDSRDDDGDVVTTLYEFWLKNDGAALAVSASDRRLVWHHPVYSSWPTSFPTILHYILLSEVLERPKAPSKVCTSVLFLHDAFIVCTSST